MTPVEVIALSGCSRPEDGVACSICVSAAEVHVKAVESAGLVVVSADDAKIVASIAAHHLAFVEPELGEAEAIQRVLRAALPERRTDG